MGASALLDNPGTRRETVQLPVITANTAPFDATQEIALLKAPDNITIESVRIAYPLAITGHAANRKNLNIKTRSAAYGGAAEVANKDFTAGTDATANTVEELWAPTGTAGDIASGGYLTLEVELVGTGVAMGSPTIFVDWRPQE